MSGLDIGDTTTWLLPWREQRWNCHIVKSQPVCKEFFSGVVPYRYGLAFHCLHFCTTATNHHGVWRCCDQRPSKWEHGTCNLQLYNILSAQFANMTVGDSWSLNLHKCPVFCIEKTFWIQIPESKWKNNQTCCHRFEVLRYSLRPSCSWVESGVNACRECWHSTHWLHLEGHWRKMKKVCQCQFVTLILHPCWNL